MFDFLKNKRSVPPKSVAPGPEYSSPDFYSSPFPTPQPDEFVATVLETYTKELPLRSIAAPLDDQILSRAIAAIKVAYIQHIIKRSQSFPKTACDVLINVFVDCLIALTRKLPNFTTKQTPKFGEMWFVSQQIVPFVTTERNQKTWASDDILDAYEAFTTPFRETKTKDFLFFSSNKLLHWFDTIPPCPQMPILLEIMDENGDYDQKVFDVWERDVKRIYAQQGPIEAPLLETPFFRTSDLLIPEQVDIRQPLTFAETTRFRHQWVVGDTGAGKTTFISAMLAQDFKRVERGEASVFVMDSQNELIPDIARLDIFAPSGSLHGKLIYLEPDPDYPLALNIFDVNREVMGKLSNKDRAMLENGALWMVDFFLSSLVKSEASPHQDTFLNYIVPALMVIPDATIFTFKELLEPAPRNGPAPGYEKFNKYFTRLHPDTQQWLEHRMHSTELAATRNAIRARLDGFTARGLFRDMFSHPRNKLDLLTELQSSKVILVNTMKGLLKQGTEPFGRYFIARLVQAMEERMFLARGAKLPVFAYIDEASDYIAEDENVEELLDKARKQSMGFIFANQREGQITNPTVRDALSRAAIQARGQARSPDRPPHWTVAISGQEPIDVLVPNVGFQKMPVMTDDQYAQMMREMRSRYSNPVAYQPQSAKEEIIIDVQYEEVADPPLLSPPSDDVDTAPKPWKK